MDSLLKIGEGFYVAEAYPSPLIMGDEIGISSEITGHDLIAGDLASVKKLSPEPGKYRPPQNLVIKSIEPRGMPIDMKSNVLLHDTYFDELELGLYENKVVINATRIRREEIKRISAILEQLNYLKCTRSLESVQKRS